MASNDSAPPTYEQATGSSSLSHRDRNGLTPQQRRSLEDERRPLPEGWIRAWDPSNQHQFFVDTRTNPPRSVWTHPHDDPEYLDSLSAEERERLQEQARQPNHADIMAESTDEEDNTGSHDSKDKRYHDSKVDSKVASTTTTHPSSATAGSSSAGASSSSATRPANQTKGAKKLGRSLKDKLTGTTHEQRVRERAAREAAEREEFRQQQHFRQQMSRAMETGRPQYLGKDNNGTDVYIEPPGAVISDTRGVSYQSPYASQGFYGPTVQGRAGARFIRPEVQYHRPYGPGYGGGLGLPIAGGLAGGLLLGSLLTPF